MLPLKGTILVRYPASVDVSPTPHDLEPFVAKGLSGTGQFQTVACDVTKRPEALPAILASMPELQVEATIESMDGKLLSLTPHDKNGRDAYENLSFMLYCFERSSVVPDPV